MNKKIYAYCWWERKTNEAIESKVKLGDKKEIEIENRGRRYCHDDLDKNLHITLTIKLKLNYINENNGEPNDTININRDNYDYDLPIEKAHQIDTVVQNLVIKHTDAKRVIVHT